MKKKEMRKKSKEGICSLTGVTGKFVKSHILPQALTSRGGYSDPFIEAGVTGPAIKRFTSWYDYNLVTAEGEEYLKKIDDEAISILRKNELVWSSWGKKTS